MNVLLLSLLAATGSEDSVRRYAVVIGVNRPAKADQRALKYADDDAVRFFDVFREVSGDSALFALLDEETQRLRPDAVTDAELPTEAAIDQRIQQMFARIKSDRDQGKSTEFYLVYSGHGYVDERGEGNLGLMDGTFSRSELYDRVLENSPAHVNHVIIDACDAYFFVQSRGSDEEVEALLSQRAREFLDRRSLSKYPNTGAILSTASAAETHEWSEIRGGVFSHSVRSALLGAADADADGSISYEEIESFVLAAGAGVKHVDASRAVFVSAPEKNRSHPVLSLDAIRRSRRLHLGEEVAGRMALLDDEGRRYLDLNKSPGYRLALNLLPGRQYFLRHDSRELSVPSEGDVTYATLLPSESTIAARGAGVADAYSKGLFSVPYGPQLVVGFRLRNVETVQMEAPRGSSGLTTAAIVVGGAAVVAAGVGTTTFILGNGAKSDYDAATDLNEVNRLDGRIRTYDSATNVAVGAAVGLGVTAGVLLLVEWLTE